MEGDGKTGDRIDRTVPAETRRMTPVPQTRPPGASEPSGGRPGAPPEVAEAAARPRAVLAHYVLVERIGEGAMGEVYKAWDRSLGRWVALKLLKSRDDELVQRFLREANLAAQLTHPNITRIYEAGADGERVFLAMELIEGVLPLDAGGVRRWAAQVMRDAARGVQHAHEHGIVHRDLKPSNLLTTKDGAVYVTDFGMARSLREGGSLTVSGAVLGTPAYMAPEQARGERGDERTDVFGLGATLFTLVEGRPPRAGDSIVEVLESAIRTPVPGISGRDDLPVIVRKATEQAPGDRYPSAAALADDLDRYLDGLPIHARPIGVAGRAWRLAKRHPRAAVVLSTLLLTILAIGAWGFVEGGRRAARRALEARADRVLERADGVLENIRQMQGAALHEADAMARAVADYGALAEEALALAPGYVPALHRRGRALLVGERYAEAEAVFTRILAGDPNDEAARSGRARARLLKIDLEAPVATATSEGMVFEAAPPDADADALLQSAAADFALLSENHPDAAAGPAALAYYAGDHETARRLLEERLAAQPYLARERLMLAHAQLVAEDFESAAANAGRLVRRGYDEATARSIHAYALAGLGRLDEAVEDMAQALALRPDADPQRNFMAFWLVQLGRGGEALAHYDRLLESHPDHVTYLLGRSLARQRSGDGAGALADARRACRLAPDDAEAHWTRGNALLGGDEAIAAFDRAIELDPTYTAAYGQRGFAHLTSGHHAEAERDGRRAIEAEPEYAPWRFLRAMALVGLERAAEAEPELDRALELGLSPGTGHLMRGRVRQMRGDLPGALADLEEAVRLGETVESETLAELRRAGGK